MFLLDTNILSERIRAKPNLPVVRKLLSYEPALLFASEMTRYGLAGLFPQASAPARRQLLQPQSTPFERVPGLVVENWFAEG
ncbi:MAG: hypothetical protein ACREU8_02850 [Gammaproteobacteria bacterium]